MATITLRLPDDTHERLKSLAKTRKVSMNKLFEELSVRTLTEFDVETRFLARAKKGSVKKGLGVLDRLDKAYSSS